MHRGYDIKDLAASCSFLEVCYLLLNGSLSTQKQNKNFAKEVSDHTILTEQLRNLLIAFQRSAHLMSITLSEVGSLSAFYLS